MMLRNRTLRAAALWLLLAALLCGCAGVGDLTQHDSSLRAGGVTIDYRDLSPRASGHAEAPLLAITGYAVTKEMWDPEFVRGLSKHRRVILMDNRGMGPSEAPAADFGIDDMARDAAALLDGLGIRQANVLGWSMGGMVAQELALQRPELVRTLTLYATAADNIAVMPVLDRMAAMPLSELRASMFPADWADKHPDNLSRMPARPRPADMNVIGRQYAAIRNWAGTPDRLQVLRMPVLLLAGGQDWVCPPEQSRRMAAAISGARLEVLPAGGHWMMHQFPPELAQMVNDFLQ